MKRYVVILMLGLTCFLTACGYTDYVKEFIEKNAVSGSSLSGSVTSGNSSGSGVQVNSSVSGGVTSGAVANVASGSGVYSAEYVTADMQSAEYWIGKSFAKDKVLLHSDEIDSVNKKRREQLAGDSNAVYYDIQNYEEKVKGSVLHMLMAQEDLLNTTIYDDKGERISKETIQTYIENCGIGGLSDFNEVNYGIICYESEVEKLPATYHNGGFRLTFFPVNEPVLVLYTSEDKAWYFVMGKNCAGWVSKDAVALCDNKNQWLEAQKMDDYIVVTARNLSVERSQIRMGTRLELASKEEAATFAREHPVHDSYIVRMPIPDKKGKLMYEFSEIPMGEDVHRGYLEYTRTNILTQTMKYLGVSIEKGVFAEGMTIDCIYSCFGFELPLEMKTWGLIPTDNRVDIAKVEDKITKTDTNYLNPGMIIIQGDKPYIYLGYQDQKAFVLGVADDVMSVQTVK